MSLLQCYPFSPPVLSLFSQQNNNGDMCVLVAQSSPTLCDPKDWWTPSPPDYSVRGILQARILEWAAILFSRGSSWPRGLNPGLLHCRPDSLPSEPPGKPKVKALVAQQCPTLCNRMDYMWLSKLLWPWNSPRKNTGVGSHSLLLENLPDPGIEPKPPALQADSLLSEPPGNRELTKHGRRL